MAVQIGVPILNGEVLVSNDAIPQKAQVHEDTIVDRQADQGQLIECDVLVVGAGFSGITAIHRLRRLGMSVKCFESASDFGGVWYWNRYPGARVDSEGPFYQLNIPEVYRDWSFSERFPGHNELRAYMAHIDKVLNLRKDTIFDARVDDCSWDGEACKWTIKTQQGHTAKAKYLLCATGLLHRTYTPEFDGMHDYKGEIYHSGAWKEDFDGTGKTIAIIGAGATAVQITQELGKVARELIVLVRRPSYCLAMKQRRWSIDEDKSWKSFLPSLFKSGRESFAGFPTARRPESVLDIPTKERERYWNELWDRGGFQFGLSNYGDVSTNPESNKIVYDFWRKKVCERLTDTDKQKIMAPEKPPYFYGTKRNPLEQDYYEVLNQSNVRIHNLAEVPLRGFYESGLVMADGTRYEADAVALATGFDSYSGSMTQMGLKNKVGVDLKDLWRDGLNTYLGLTISGFPNMFMVYTPQAPTSLSNGPTIIEAQVETCVDMIKKLEHEHAKTIEARREAEQEWKEKLNAMSKHTLIPYTDSWWNGANIPGKKSENMIYVGGINTYEPLCRATMEDWKGFDVVTADA